MLKRDYRHLFGPVPSRRLGRSLGVDLVPFKTCSFDCIFCQLGRTTEKTVERKEYVPLEFVRAELEHWAATSGSSADYITLSGSGEPTLHSRFGEVIACVRQITDTPVALLTNSSLLADPGVREQAALADVVKVSLSAWDGASLEHINRPHPSVTFERIIDGLTQFRKEFRGEIWMEVFLLWGINATRTEVDKIAEWVARIAPDTVQLNTAVRPPCEEYAYRVPPEKLAELANRFNPPAEGIAEYSAVPSESGDAGETAIRNLIQRRPCTLAQIATVFGLHRNEVSKYLGKLTRTGQVRLERRDGETYYVKQKKNGVFRRIGG